MLLNDVSNKRQRLAVLLGGSVERYASGGPRAGAMFAVVLSAVLLLLLLWVLFRLVFV